MKKDNQKTEEISIKIRVKDAIPDAPVYNIKTMADLANALTTENIDRFMADFDTGIRTLLMTFEAMKAVAETMGESITMADMGFREFTWIDDRPR